LFAVLSAIEVDLRKVVVSHLGLQMSSKDFLGHLWTKAYERYDSDTELTARMPALE